MDTKMNNIILVPTDFSEVCNNAMNQAVDAAKFLNYKIVLLHVIDKNTKSQLKKENEGSDSIDNKLSAIASEIIKSNNIEVDTLAKEGDIFTTISEVANDIGANLMYLGTHGKVGMQKLTGSFALKVVTSSPVPVVVVQKRPFREGYKKIVLPITSDAGPWEKTKWASFIAQNFKAEIHVYYLNLPEIKTSVDIITRHFDENNVVYKTVVAESSGFSKSVVDYATANVADMIMIMTNPDKSFTKFLLGSYDEEMIFNPSQIPVMCINPRKYNWEKIFKI
ncbi:MAG: universal stress protein [Bacteroidales bacterium]|nr:universal stress protein [Bacteroidales bacterium]MCF8403345.1 universal stress protein [Bacteroidales bacterium]